MSRRFVTGTILVLLLAAMAMILLLTQKDAIVDENAHNILGIVETSLLQRYQDPTTQDSLHRRFLAIHEKVRRGEADSTALRRLVRQFYEYYRDGRIDSAEAKVLVTNVDYLASK